MTAGKPGPPGDPVLLSDAIQTMKVLSGLLLLCFKEYGQGLRDTVSGNFVARGMVCLESIFRCWLQGAEQDAWILHRSLLDRLFHLHSLADRNDFAAFDDFSFLALYEARHRLLSDPTMRHKAPKSLKKLQSADRKRYGQLVAAGLKWCRPKAEEVAKGMTLGFLYRFGYDYASTHVHPTSLDGEADFLRLTSPAPVIPLPDTTVVRNSILAQTMLTREALNTSTMQWRTIIYNFLGQVLGFLGDGNAEYKATFLKIGRAGPDFALCKPSGETHEA